MDKETDVPKNPCKAPKYYYDTHDCGTILASFMKRLAGNARSHEVSLQAFFITSVALIYVIT
jgi:hypothetical protein